MRELADLDRSQRVATWIRIEQHLRKYSFDQTEFLYSYSSVVTYIIPQANLSRNTCADLEWIRQHNLQSLKSLALFYCDFTMAIIAIPSWITVLELGGAFNQTLTPGLIPDSVTHLTFGRRFHNGSKPLSVGVLPPKVMHLTFGDAF